LSSEREEERRRLEEKLRQLEDDLGETSTTSAPAATLTTAQTLLKTFSASSTPSQSPAKVCRRRSDFPAEDEDETLLHEVDEEMKRGKSDLSAT